MILSTNSPFRNPGTGPRLVAATLARAVRQTVDEVWLELTEWVHEEGEPLWVDVLEAYGIGGALDAAPMTAEARQRLVQLADREDVRELLLSAARSRACNDTRGWATALWRALDLTRKDRT